MFNYEKEKIKFVENKLKEEKVLKENNVNQDIIKNLYDYDWNDFKRERNYQNKLTYLNLDEIPIKSSSQIYSYFDLYHNIEDERLIQLLNQTDELTKKILLYVVNDYSYEEIAKTLNVKNYVIHYKIRKLKRIYKK